MDERKIRSEYKELFDSIHASDELRQRVLAQKPKKRSIKPVINIAGSVAAAVMIFSAVGNYTFETDRSGVIRETFVSQTERPDMAERSSDAIAADTAEAESTAEPGGAATPAANPVPTAKPAAKPTAQPKTESKRGGANGVSDTPSYSGSARGDSAATRNSAAQEQTNSETEGGSITFEIEADQKAYEAQTAAPESGANAGGNSVDIGNTDDLSRETGEAPVLRGMRGIGSAALRMNSGSVLSAIPQSVSVMSASKYAGDGIYHQEEWDNNRYFDYIGIDLLGKIVLPTDVGYIGDDTAYFMVDQDGVPQNDTRIFAFEGGEKSITVITSKDTAYAETYLSYPGLEISDISGSKAVVFETDSAYKCYMIYNSTSFIIDTVELTEDELAQLLVSIAG